jgi:putative transposase
MYPNNTQKVLLAKTFGCVRYFWNSQVETFNSYDKEANPKPEYKTSTVLRNEIEWMKEVSAAAIQQKEIDFKEYRQQKFNKERKGKAVGRPTFKRKSNKQSYRLPNQKFDLKGSKIRLEKIGWVTLVIDRPTPEDAKFMSVTISKNPSGQYYASVLVEQEIKHFDKTNKEVGIDVGLKVFFKRSDGETVANPRYFRDSQAELAKMQRILSRKVKGSNRWKSTKRKIARIYNRIANQRAWFLQTESTKIVKEFDVIRIENLNIAGLSAKCKPKQDEAGNYLPNGQSKKVGLNKSITDASWGLFFMMLDYKCKWYGKELIKIDRFAPSSKTCSGCGWVDKNMTLQKRTFACPDCGLILDRDENAAINIQAWGVDHAIQTQSNETMDCVEASMITSNS